MATNVYMEALSPTMEEGRLVTWSKHEGDAVSSGDTLAEVETDKAVMELVARADGHVLKTLVAEGETVPVGTVVAYIGEPGDVIPESGSGSAADAGAREEGEPAGDGGAARSAPKGAAAAARPTAVPAAPRGAAASPAKAARAPEPERIKASPLARRMAKEAGVDLRLVAGTGPGGRVVRRDLETVKSVVPPAAGRSPAAPPGAADAYEDVPLTQIRKTIARRLAASLGPVPHFFLTAEVDMERAADARADLNRALGEGIKVSFNDIILKATALALVRHRACNAWFQDTHIRYWTEVHLGMAVAVEDGLITPVLRHADRKSLAEISVEARALADRARERRLTPEEYSGSTFSVSNLGMFDIDQFTGVINPPECGILAVGAVTPRPVAIDGAVVTRRRLRLTMSCDHRVIDGATGAGFMKTLRQMLENPLAML